MKRGAPQPELCYFYDSSGPLFLSKHIFEVSSVGCAPQCVRDTACAVSTKRNIVTGVEPLENMSCTLVGT